jgi:acyl carrier protein
MFGEAVDMSNETAGVTQTHNDGMNSALREIWTKFLEKPPVTDDDEFFDLGGNSVLLLAMLGAVQECFNREINMEDLADGITVRRIAGLLS